MGLPTLNQALHLIVCKKWLDPSSAAVSNITTAGDVLLIKNADGNARFIYKDNDDTLKSSNLLNADIFAAVEAYRKGDMRGSNAQTKVDKKYVVIGCNDATLASDDVAAVHLNLKNYLVIGDGNNYIKDGYAQLHINIARNEVIIRLAKSLTDNMKRDGNLGIKISVGTVTEDSAGNVTAIASTVITDTVLKTSTLDSLITNYGSNAGNLKLIVEETMLDWDLGRLYFQRPDFDAYTNTIDVVSGGVVNSDYQWASIKVFVSHAGVSNGYKYADLEYFCKAERGNYWRLVGFPYNTTTQPLVDPTIEYQSLTFDLSYRGDAEDIQKSPKQLVLIAPASGAGAISMDSIISDIETLMGW